MKYMTMLPRIKRTTLRALVLPAAMLLWAMPLSAGCPEVRQGLAGEVVQREGETCPVTPDERISPEELRKRQEAFISSQAKLTQAEAAYFFPLFRELRKKQRSVRHTIRKNLRRVQEERLSEKECDRLLQQNAKLERQHVDLELSYYNLWRKKLTATKIMNILAADRQFSRKVFEHKVR